MSDEKDYGHKHQFKYQRLEQGWLCYCGEYYRQVVPGLWELANRGAFAAALDGVQRK